MREVESSNPSEGYILLGRTSLLQYLETHGETGGFAIYCQPRHKGSLILSQDSVGGILEDGSPREVASQYRCLPNQERETE